jgi:peroxiredoxin
MLIPRQKTADLVVPTLSGKEFNLANEAGERGTLVVFYRGLHCPICANYLKELAAQLPALTERGINVIALSSDTKERTQTMADKVGSEELNFGYDLPLPMAKEWGLFISTSRGKTSLGIEEPALFAEPGLFLVSPDQSLYFSSIQTMPFIRPSLVDLIGALDFVIEKKYPARGEYTGEV